jgi:hypothetical protein
MIGRGLIDPYNFPPSPSQLTEEELDVRRYVVYPITYGGLDTSVEPRIISRCAPHPIFPPCPILEPNNQTFRSFFNKGVIDKSLSPEFVRLFCNEEGEAAMGAFYD